nr:hypothetical protein [Tanacetum cinerariifolium]
MALEEYEYQSRKGIRVQKNGGLFILVTSFFVKKGDEEALCEAPPATTTAAICNAYTRRVTEQQEVACLMLGEGQSVSTYAMKMKAYLEKIEGLGYPMPLVLGVNLILTLLSKDYDQFVQNYNMHGTGKTIPKLHVMLKLVEKGILKKAPTILAIRQGRIQKPKLQARGKGKKKGKSKLAYDPKHKIPSPAKKEHPAKDSECHHCHKTRYYRRNYPLYLAELKKNKASTSGTSESAVRLLNMVPTKKVNKTPCEIWHGKVLNLSYLKKSSMKSTTAMSSMEDEYIAVIEAIWIHKFIFELGIVPNNNRPIDMYCENTGTITIADEPGVQKGAKHFRQKYHFIREVIQKGDIRICKVHTNNNLADLFTKPMSCTKHVEHARNIKLRPTGILM